MAAAAASPVAVSQAHFFALAATVKLGSYRKQKQLLQQAATVASFVYRRQKSADKPPWLSTAPPSTPMPADNANDNSALSAASHRMRLSSFSDSGLRMWMWTRMRFSLRLRQIFGAGRSRHAIAGPTMQPDIRQI